MRFNNRVTFVWQEESEYDPMTGRYENSDPIEVVKPAKVSSMGLNRKAELFGDIREQVTIARLQHPYDDNFTWVEVDDLAYKVMQESNYKKGVLFLQRDNFEDNRDS